MKEIRHRMSVYGGGGRSSSAPAQLHDSITGKEIISEENGSTHFIYHPFYCHKQ